MKWKTKRSRETFSGVTLDLLVLESLNATIDELFDELQNEGREDELDLLCPYFGVVWPSARALAMEIAEQSFEKKHGALRVLEVGCGLAVPSMVLLRQLKMSKLTLSDCHPEVRRFLTQNLELNGIGENDLTYEDWSFQDLGKLNQKWDLVIGSDILYESQHPEDLADALDRVTHPNGRILISDPARPYLQKFQDEMKARGWDGTAKIRDSWLENGDKKEIFILDFSRAKTVPLQLR